MTDQFENEPSFEELLNAQETLPGDMDFAPGEKVTGTVVRISEETIFVDWGGKGEGWAEKDEFKGEDGELTIKVGDKVELTILEFGSHGAHLGTKFRSSGGEGGIQMLSEAFDHGLPIEGTVKDVNKGGFDIVFSGTRAFCPVSQMDINYVEEPSVFVGTTQLFKVIEFDTENRRIVVSRRGYLEDEKRKLAEATRETLEVGSEYDGIIRKLMPYGAFIDFGGLDGFVHISEIAHERVEDPADHLKEGEQVKVKVIKIETDNKGKERIGLSIKALIVDPWTKGLPFGEGDVVKGIVRRMESFGAFVELIPAVDGLLHISEISYERVNKVEDKLEENQEIEVKILEIDSEKRRIALSMKALVEIEVQEAPVEESSSKYSDQSRSGNVIRRRKAVESTDETESTIDAEPAKQEENTEPEKVDMWAEMDKQEKVKKEEKLSSDLQTPRIGLVTTGIVRTMMPYGIFMDLPKCGEKTTGLLHNSEIDSEKSDPQKNIAEGDTFEVEIVKIDEQGRLGLSQKSVTAKKEREEVKHFQKKMSADAKMGTMADLFGGLKLKK